MYNGLFWKIVSHIINSDLGCNTQDPAKERKKCRTTEISSIHLKTGIPVDVECSSKFAEQNCTVHS